MMLVSALRYRRRRSRAEFKGKAGIGAPFDQAAVVHSHVGVAEPHQDVGEAGRCRTRTGVRFENRF